MKSNTFSGYALLATVFAVAAFVFVGLPVVSSLLALASIATAIAGRPQLRKDDELRGAGLSVLALLTSIGVLIYLAMIYLYPFLVIGIFGVPSAP